MRTLLRGRADRERLQRASLASPANRMTHPVLATGAEQRALGAQLHAGLRFRGQAASGEEASRGVEG